MRKEYFAKIYKRDRVTVNQYVKEGDAEGFESAPFIAAIDPYGSATFVGRNRAQAYPQVKKKAVVLDGVTSYIIMPSVGQVGSGFGEPDVNISNAYTVVIRHTKPNWANATQEVLVWHEDTGSPGSGFSLDRNLTTTGKLTVRLSMGNVMKSASVDLSTITAGEHQISFGSDGRYLQLNIDGVQVAQFDNGIAGNTTDYGNLNVYLGARYNNNTGVRDKFAAGTLDYFSIYGSLLTPALLLEMYDTKMPIGSGCLLHFDFNAINTTNEDGSFTLGYDTASNTTLYTCLYLGNCQLVDSASIYLERSIKTVTSTGGLTLQGPQTDSLTLIPITGNTVYSGSAWFKADPGEQVTISLAADAGASLQSTLTATGQWQRITVTGTTDPAATVGQLRVLLRNANASVKTFYVDKMALNNGATPYEYFDDTFPSTGSSVYAFNALTNVFTGTFTTYTYRKTWSKEISSEFGYEQEINSAGSKVKVTLARDPGSFGERVDVDFGLEVRFYCADDQFPNGQLIFTGYIANYIPDYNKNCVNIEVYSYGEQLSNYTVQSGQSQLTAMPIDNGAYNTSVWGSAYAVVIKPTSNIRLKSVVLKMARLAGNLPKEKNLTLYSGTPVNDIVGTTAGSFSYTTSNTAIAFTDSAAVPETNPDLVKFDFDTTQILAAGQSYYVLITFDTDEFFYLRGGTAAGDIINGMSYPPIVGGYGYTVSINNSGSTMAQIGGLYCELYSDTGSTVAKYLSEDPSVILKDILTNYSLQGGSVTFDDASIELTGTKVSYTFRSSSVYDALKKCLELSPANWFFYIDHATKKVHFKLKGTTVNHKFVIGKHLQSVNFEDRSENIINSVEFTGGVDDNGVNLYRRYKDTGSVDLYGQKLRIYVDNRVTNPDTADTIANAIIEQYKMPEVRANITILDGVYDIESIRPGDIVGFANAGGSSDSSSNWDAAFWDEGYWDFDVNNPSTLAIQIAKHTYTPEQAIMTLSTVPPDVNKRIEDINRNLEAQQTLNNPEVAEEVVGFGEVTE